LTVNCSKKRLEQLLSEEKIVSWNPIEDMTLRQPADSLEYKYLVQIKGVEEINRRKTFLSVQ
jgi:hypothetical protein